MVAASDSSRNTVLMGTFSRSSSPADTTSTAAAAAAAAPPAPSSPLPKLSGPAGVLELMVAETENRRAFLGGVRRGRGATQRAKMLGGDDLGPRLEA